MKFDDLTKAVLYWLEYERLCGRGQLLSEMSLRFPIGEYLIATQDHQLHAEMPYPEYMQPKGSGRRKAMDYCMFRKGGTKVWTHVFESKWVNDKRAFKQEVFDDIVRLEGVRRAAQIAPFDRILLIAGYSKEVNRLLDDKDVSQALPRELGDKKNINVMRSTGSVLKRWKVAAKAVPFDQLPLAILVKLEAAKQEANFGCWIWKINSVSKRSLRDVG